jgi:hypothetical protein
VSYEDDKVRHVLLAIGNTRRERNPLKETKKDFFGKQIEREI